jgi:protein-L-isoaspartate(D-aspartate) O-methyltransferase
MLSGDSLRHPERKKQLMRARLELIGLLAAEIADERVLAAIAAVPRELFVADDQLSEAYANRALPIGCGQTISQPLVVARMAELLDLRPADRVLEIGTGSGYGAAVLARLCSHVWSVERHADLAAGAELALGTAGIENVTCLVSDGAVGLPDRAPFDAISVAAATRRRVLERLGDQLAPSGRLVAPLSRRGSQHLVTAERPADGGPLSWRMFEAVRFVPLVPGKPS